MDDAEDMTSERDFIYSYGEDLGEAIDHAASKASEKVGGFLRG